MDKIVTFQSSEYHELIAMGWYVVSQIGASTVLMAHEGTVYGESKGLPSQNGNPIVWQPHWGGKPGPATVVGPQVAHDWREIQRATSQVTGETVVMFLDMLSTNPAVPPGFEYFKNDVYHGPVLWYSQTYWKQWDDVREDFNLRAFGVANFNIWQRITDKFIGGPTLVTIAYLIPSASGPVQYRVKYDPPGTIHLHPNYTSANNEYVAAV